LHQRHGLLRKDPVTGQVLYAFIHGNWALCNSRPDGRWCGVKEEIKILLETGEVSPKARNPPLPAAHFSETFAPFPVESSCNRPTTVLQAIAEAGGTTMFASLKKVRLVRLEKGQQNVHVLDLRSAVKGTIQPPATGPFYIRDGDVISVPQSAF
jgi:hypothetical protein